MLRAVIMLLQIHYLDLLDLTFTYVCIQYHVYVLII